MLRYAVVCLFIAVLLSLFAFSDPPARADGMARVLCLVFLVLAVSSGAIGWIRGGRRARSRRMPS